MTLLINLLRYCDHYTDKGIFIPLVQDLCGVKVLIRPGGWRAIVWKQHRRVGHHVWRIRVDGLDRGSDGGTGCGSVDSRGCGGMAGFSVMASMAVARVDGDGFDFGDLDGDVFVVVVVVVSAAVIVEGATHVARIVVVGIADVNDDGDDNDNGVLK